MFESFVAWLLGVLAIPKISLPWIFVVSFVSATLIPMGSEPAVFAVVKANPDLLIWAILVATLGNTLGGMVDYWIGHGAHKAFAKEQESRWFGWLRRFGAKTMLLSWLPVIGDPICTLGGWLRLPFWPCVVYMAIGKLCRYIAITALLLYVPNGVWHRFADWVS